MYRGEGLCVVTYFSRDTMHKRRDFSCPAWHWWLHPWSLWTGSANFGRILSDRQGQERTSSFGPQLCGKPLLCVRLPGLDPPGAEDRSDG